MPLQDVRKRLFVRPSFTVELLEQRNLIRAERVALDLMESNGLAKALRAFGRVSSKSSRFDSFQHRTNIARQR